MNQLPLRPFTGEELRDGGIQVALDSASRVQEDWAERAYEILKSYIRTQVGAFMCEHVRAYAKQFTDLSEPPSARAWGGIIQRAAREKLIKCIGTKPVENARAHRANASLWVAL